VPVGAEKKVPVPVPCRFRRAAVAAEQAADTAGPTAAGAGSGAVPVAAVTAAAAEETVAAASQPPPVPVELARLTLGGDVRVRPGAGAAGTTCTAEHSSIAARGAGSLPLRVRFPDRRAAAEQNAAAAQAAVSAGTLADRVMPFIHPISRPPVPPFAP
jgi:hypothetical protein